MATIAGITSDALQKTNEILLQARQQDDACSLRRLREMLGDALCTRSTRCMPDKEAGEEERSTEDDLNCLQT